MNYKLLEKILLTIAILSLGLSFIACFIGMSTDYDDICKPVATYSIGSSVFFGCLAIVNLIWKK